DRGRLLEVEVERDEVEERQSQVLGRRVVDVGEERVGGLVAHGAGEAGEEALDAATAVPADERRRDLVADREAEEGGVAGATHRLFADGGLDAGGAAGLVEQ